MNDSNYMHLNRMGRGVPGSAPGRQSCGAPVLRKEIPCEMPPSGIRPWMETGQRGMAGMRPGMGEWMRQEQPVHDWSEQFPVGMGYVPMQRWQATYSMEEGFCRGTIFPILDLPFMMGRCI